MAKNSDLLRQVGPEGQEETWAGGPKFGQRWDMKRVLGVNRSPPPQYGESHLISQAILAPLDGETLRRIVHERSDAFDYTRHHLVLCKSNRNPFQINMRPPSSSLREISVVCLVRTLRLLPRPPAQPHA